VKEPCAPRQIIPTLAKAEVVSDSGIAKTLQDARKT
jgi:hypothetical protein